MMRIPGEAFFPAGEAAGPGGDPLETFLRKKRSQMAHTALVEAQNTYAARMEQWVEDARTGRTGAKAAGLTKEALARHTRTVDGVLARTAMDAEAKEAFRAWAKGRGGVLGARMAVFEDAQRRAHALAQHEARRGGVFRAAALEPEWHADHAAQLEEAHVLSVGQGLFAPGEAQKRLALDTEALKDVVRAALSLADPEKNTADGALPEGGGTRLRETGEGKTAADAACKEASL